MPADDRGKSRADGSVLAEFAYTLDGNGRRIALEETVAGKVRRLSWRYDRAGRLLEESIDDGSGPRVTAHAWDGAGNRIRRDDAGLVTTYVYDANDRLLSETTGGATTTYAWDANGNLARRQEGGKTTVYHWNSQNRLTRIDDGARRIDYGYDAEGRRIKRLVSEGTNSVETHYVIDSARAHGETIVERTRVGSGAFSERTYVHTPDGTGELLSELKGGTAIHYYPDGQGSTRLIADQAQNVLETHAHDAFGRRTGGAGGDGHQYTGEYFDAASGFYHLRARDYDPRIGRFVSMDEHPGTPRIPLTLNKYLYGNADPVNNIDPSGNMFISLATPLLNNLSRIQYSIVGALRILNKVDIVVTRVQIFHALKIAYNYTETMDWKKAVASAKGDRGFINAIANFDTAMAALFHKLPAIMADSRVYSQVGKFINGPKNGLAIYLPTPGKNNKIPYKTIKSGTFRLSKSVRDIYLEVGNKGGQAGRVFGVGHTEGHGTGRTQWFRQDWHEQIGHYPKNRCYSDQGDAYHYHCGP